MNQTSEGSPRLFLKQSCIFLMLALLMLALLMLALLMLVATRGRAAEPLTAADGTRLSTSRRADLERAMKSIHKLVGMPLVTVAEGVRLGTLNGVVIDTREGRVR